MSKLAEYLNRHIVGNVFERPDICARYATGGSILEMTPKLVALPESADDIRHILQFVYQLAVRNLILPVTARGSGSDTTGASLGTGLVLSLEKMNHIEEFDARGRLIRVQSGLTLGELNAALRFQGLWLPIAASPSATIGGLIATGAADPYAARYGGITNYVDRLELILGSGDLILVEPLRVRDVAAKISSNSAEGVLYRQLEHILDDEADTILDRSMQPFDLAGYAGLTKVRDGHSVNLLPLIFGSQGTLGIISDIILRLEPLPSFHSRLLVSFQDLDAAQDFLNIAYKLEPSILQVIDHRILSSAVSGGKISKFLDKKATRGLLVIVGFDGNRMSAERALGRCLSALPDGALHAVESAKNAADFRALENIVTGFLNDTATGPRPPIADNVFIPSGEFLSFVAGLRILEDTTKLDLPFFGSFATSSYSVRPKFDQSSLADRKRILDFLEYYHELVASCRGSFTGSSPEGRLKAMLTTRSLPIGERQIYAAVKEAFDPRGILNPGVKLGANPSDVLRFLKTDPDHGIIKP